MYWLLLILAATKLIPAGIGLIHFARLRRSLKFFVGLMLFGVLTEISLFILATLNSFNIFIIHFTSIIEVTLVVMFFYYELQDKKIKDWTLLFLGVAVSMSLAYVLFPGNFYHYPSIPRAIDAVLIIFCCIYLFFEMATTGDSLDLLTKESYYLTGAVMFYYTATFLTWVMMKYVLNDQTVVNALYGTHAYINAFCNFVYAYGLWIASRSYSLRT
jgi:hypothetical protein